MYIHRNSRWLIATTVILGGIYYFVDSSLTKIIISLLATVAPLICNFFFLSQKRVEVSDSKKKYERIVGRIVHAMIISLFGATFFWWRTMKLLDTAQVLSIWIVLGYIVATLIFWQFYIPFRPEQKSSANSSSHKTTHA